MSHLNRIVLVAALLALGVAACGSERPAATVNGEVISLDQVVAIAPTTGSGATANAEQIREVLSGLVIESALIQAAEEQYGVVVTEAQIQERIANPPPRYAGVFNDLSAAEATEAQLRSQAIRSLVRDEVSPLIISEAIALDDFVEENRPFATRVCAQIMLFLDEAAAEEAAGALRAGESFETVSNAALTATPDRVGALDNTASCPQFVSTLDPSLFEAVLAAEVGEWVGPVALNSGFLLVRVNEREEPPASGDLMDFVDSRLISDYFTPWLNEAVRVAVIEIDPSIGTWSAAGVGIIPPE